MPTPDAEMTIPPGNRSEPPTVQRAVSPEAAPKHRDGDNGRFEQAVLLLQGGGALGSYQAGVYQALAEADLHPDWVAGISIGAVNSALMVGNPPEKRVERLREFWEAVSDADGKEKAQASNALERADADFFSELWIDGELERGLVA